MQTVAEIRLSNLRLLVARAGKAATLARRTGIAAAYLSQLLNGTPHQPSGVARAVGDATARKLEAGMGLPRGWMDQQRTKDEQSAIVEAVAEGGVPVEILATDVQSDDVSVKPQEEMTIMQFDAAGAMGHGVTLRDQPGVIQSWKVSAEWVQKNIRSFSAVQNLCIVTGFGDSMKPMFNPGDPLLVDIGVRQVEFDAVYFFRVGDEGFIKRLQRIPGEGLRVLSANRDFYEPWTVKPHMDFEVFGRVLKVWRGEDF